MQSGIPTRTRDPPPLAFLSHRQFQSQDFEDAGPAKDERLHPGGVSSDVGRVQPSLVFELSG